MTADESIFHNSSKLLLLHIHVDNGLVVGQSCQEVVSFLEGLRATYHIKSQERPSQHLGYTLDWKEDGSVLIHQRDYCEKILDEFSMTKANPVKGPAPMNLTKLAAEAAEPFSVNIMEKAIGMLNHLALHS